MTQKNAWYSSLQILLLAGLYFAAGQASFSLSVSHNTVTLVVFAAEGFALAAVILLGKRLWMGVFLGQLVLALYNGLAWHTALGLAMINSLEAVIGAILFYRWALKPSLRTIHDVSGLLGLIFFCLQPFSATLGILVLWLSGQIPATELGIAWFSWWFGNSLGQALITPLLLCFFAGKTDSTPRLILLTIFASLLICATISANNLTIVFAVTMPLLILIATTGGIAMVSLATILIAGITLFVTQQMTGVFVHDGKMLLVDLNLYLLGIILTGHFIAALLAEHQQARLAQQETLERLQKIASRLPGVVYQFRLNTDGSSCFPYASPAIYDIYQVMPEEVRHSAAKVFAILHPEDYNQVVASIEESARLLSPWQQEYRVQLPNGIERWLLGNALPEREPDGATLWHGFITDITERKQIEEKFRSIIDVSPVPLSVSDVQKNIGYLNPAFIKAFGYELNDIPTLHDWWQKAYPDPHYRRWALSAWQVKLNRAKRKNQIVTPLELNIHCKNDSQKTVLMSTAKLNNTYDAQNLMVLYDITELKQTESELEKQQQQLQNIIRGTNAGTWEWNVQTGELTLNERWANIIGYTLAELQPVSIQTWTNVCHPEDLKRSQALIDKHFSGELAYYDCECRLKHKQGHWVWILDRGRLMSLSDDHKPLLMAGTHIDITALKQTEAQLRLAATIFESQEGMVITDENEVILMVNQEFTNITGYSTDEIIGQTPRILSSGRQDKVFYTAMWQHIQESGAWQGEIWNRRKNGEIFPEWLTITAVKANNDTVITHYVATHADITERKRVENDLRKNQIL